MLNTSATAAAAAVLQDGNLSEQQMADAGIGLIIAGNDTSGLGITALLAILPQFPAVMERLRQEQREVRAVNVMQIQLFVYRPMHLLTASACMITCWVWHLVCIWMSDPYTKCCMET
jgi:cytochrome P450